MGDLLWLLNHIYCRKTEQVFIVLLSMGNWLWLYSLSVTQRLCSSRMESVSHFLRSWKDTWQQEKSTCPITMNTDRASQVLPLCLIQNSLKPIERSVKAPCWTLDHNCNNRVLQQRRGRRLRKRHLKSEFALPQTLSRLSQLVQFVKCLQFILELNFKRLYQSSGKEKGSRCLMFTSSANVKQQALSCCKVMLRETIRNDDF